MTDLDDRERELVALGAAVASDCLPCVEFHVPDARRAGLSDIQIRAAIRIADAVRRVPARAVLQSALARTRERPSGSAETTATGCSCPESGAPLAAPDASAEEPHERLAARLTGDG